MQTSVENQQGKGWWGESVRNIFKQGKEGSSRTQKLLKAEKQFGQI